MGDVGDAGGEGGAEAASLLDRAVLARLAHEAGGREVARQFAAAYVRLLPGRVERIRSACVAEDLAGALDAVLSLRVTSAMVGAGLLTGHAAEVEQAVARGDLGTAGAAAERLPSVAAATAAAVAAVLAAF